MGWAVWLVVAALLALGEYATRTLLLAPFAIAALMAAALAAVGVPGWINVVLFCAVAIALLVVVRPMMRTSKRAPDPIRDPSVSIMGRAGLVVERIANEEAVGAVQVGRQVWTARACDDARIYEIGEQVVVADVRGTTALVE